ncbi:MAG: ABC transporter permease [Defluviitaleaceae bacterium]|nr:ABC transporter permease [Defluviitaleaceae bacterium]
MKNVWMLTAANLRRNKNQAVIIGLLILISALFLNVGLVMYLRMDDHFDKRAEELNAPHWIAFHEGGPDMERVEFLRQVEEVADVEYDTILFRTMTLTIPSVSASHMVRNIIVPYNESQRMNPPHLLGDSIPLEGNGIYLPYFMAAGVALGTEVNITISEERFVFTLAGVTEEMVFGSIWGSARLYVSEAMFRELKEAYPESIWGLVSARMEDVNDTPLLASRYASEYANRNIWTNSLSYIRDGRTATPLIVAVIIVSFSVILLLVGLCVIRFNIINNIEENTVNIGVQKAMGYRSRQIIAAVLLQLGLVAASGGIAGLLLAQAVFPWVNGIIRNMYGLPWHPLFDVPIMGVSLFGILFTVTAFALIAARRLLKLQPLNALRGGITTHSFRRVWFPLDKTPGRLTVLLGLKQLFHHKKQGAMLGIIIACTSFACLAGAGLHYNFNVNRDEIIRTITGELPDVIFFLHDAEALAGLRERVGNRPEVRRVNVGGSTSAQSTFTINGSYLNFALVQDFIGFAGYELLAGRFPMHDNEIVMGAVAMAERGLRIGDWVYIRNHTDKTDYPYLITGSTQSMNHSGMICVAAMKRLDVNVTFGTLNVVLLPRYDLNEFIASVLETEGDTVASARNMAALSEDEYAAIGGIFSAIAYTVLAAVSCVVSLILYLVIKTSIRRRRRELGIQKALGYTTLQLMNQSAINITPIIAVGAIVGVVGGYFGFNPLFVMFTRGFGIAHANLPVPMGWMVGLCAGLVLLAYAVAMLTAWRIRKVSAYALVTE